MTLLNPKFKNVIMILEIDMRMFINMVNLVDTLRITMESLMIQAKQIPGIARKIDLYAILISYLDLVQLLLSECL